MRMLVVSVTYQNYQNSALSIQLTDFGRREVCVGGDSESVDMRQEVQRYTDHTMYVCSLITYIKLPRGFFILCLIVFSIFFCVIYCQSPGHLQKDNFSTKKRLSNVVVPFHLFKKIFLSRISGSIAASATEDAKKQVNFVHSLKAIMPYGISCEPT
jgi:hypothetical protein